MCSERHVSASSGQHGTCGGRRARGNACHAGLGTDVRSPLRLLWTARACDGDAARSVSSEFLRVLRRAPGRQSISGDLVLGERSEYVLLSSVASKLYIHQVRTSRCSSECLCKFRTSTEDEQHGHSKAAPGSAQVEGVRWLFKLHTLQSGGILGNSANSVSVVSALLPMSLPLLHTRGLIII